jgi:Protein of unknown function (DUF4058)
MPLRDHFRPPTTRYGRWHALHGGWPMVIVQQLRKQLPPGYVSAPRVYLGPYFEIDIGAFEYDDLPADAGDDDGGGGTATATQVAPSRVAGATWVVDTEVPADDEYEVEIYSAEEERELVAVIELVSPANKDRPEKRAAFANKCAAFLRRGISVSVVDLVTVRHANLYAEMMATVGHPDPTLGPDPPPLYTTTTRWTTNAKRTRGRLHTWVNPMAVGRPLPPLVVWLSDTLHLTFDLERSYEQACEDLGIR